MGTTRRRETSQSLESVATEGGRRNSRGMSKRRISASSSGMYASCQWSRRSTCLGVGTPGKAALAELVVDRLQSFLGQRQPLRFDRDALLDQCAREASDGLGGSTAEPEPTWDQAACR